MTDQAAAGAGTGAPNSGAAPISDAVYERMSWSERLDHARSATAQSGVQQHQPAEAGATEAAPSITSDPLRREDRTPRGPEPSEGAASTTVRIGDTEFPVDDVRNALAQRAARNSTRAQLPTPDAYRLELPADVKLPEGMGINPKDPAIGELRRVAYEAGLTQNQFNSLIGLHARALAAHPLFMNVDAARRAEMDKLGTAGPARIDAVSRWLDAMGAGAMKAMLVNAATVEAAERLIRAHGVKAGRVTFESSKQDSGISDEAYEQMSWSQRMDYARQAGAAR